MKQNIFASLLFTLLLLITVFMAGCGNVTEAVNASPAVTPSPTPLINEKPLTKNQIAHEAYENAMRNGQLSEIRECAYEYSFYDIDNDGVDEFIAYPGYGCWAYSIYNFFEGKINELAGVGHSRGLIIYPEKSAFSFSFGNMDLYYDTYYKLVNGKAYVAAEHEYYVTHNDDESTSTEHWYTVNNNEVTEPEYTEFIKTFAAGKEVKHGDLQWYKWVNTESPEYNRWVVQSNETETHYFRFDSNANDSISFHFNVDQHDAKLQNMKITLCDSDLKPVSKTDSFGAFDQMDYKCSISEEGIYYLKVISEIKKIYEYDYLNYKVFIPTPEQ